MKKFVTLLGLLFCFVVSSANAAIEGDSVNGSYFAPDAFSNISNFGNQIVGAGVEFPSGYSDFFGVDLSNSGITITYNNSVVWNIGAFNGLVLTDLTKSFDALTFVSSTNPLFVAGNFVASGNTASFNWQGLSFGQGDVINISAVPEPETYAMLLAGLGMMGFVARRRKNEQA